MNNAKINRHYSHFKKKPVAKTSARTHSTNFCFEAHTSELAQSLNIPVLTTNLHLLGAPATPLHKISWDASSTKRVGARIYYFPPHRICGFKKIHLQLPFVLFGNKKVHVASSLVRLAYQENKHGGSLSKAVRQESPGCYSCSLGAKIQHAFQKAIPRVSTVEYLFALSVLLRKKFVSYVGDKILRLQLEIFTRISVKSFSSVFRINFSLCFSHKILIYSTTWAVRHLQENFYLYLYSHCD